MSQQRLSQMNLIYLYRIIYNIKRLSDSFLGRQPHSLTIPHVPGYNDIFARYSLNLARSCVAYGSHCDFWHTRASVREFVNNADYMIMVLELSLEPASKYMSNSYWKLVRELTLSLIFMIATKRGVAGQLNYVNVWRVVDCLNKLNSPHQWLLLVITGISHCHDS